MTEEFRKALISGRKSREPLRFEHIQIDEDIRFGKARIGLTRFTVGDLLGYLSAGMTFDEILEDFPELTREGIVEALRYTQAREHFDPVYLVNSKSQPTPLFR